MLRKMTSASFRTLSRTRCLDLLSTAPLGRVGLSVGALPSILPVNFTLLGGLVVFRTVPGSKLDAALARTVVAFEADSYDPEGAWGWSVLVQGMAAEITAPAVLAGVQRLRLPAWALPESARRYVAVETTLVSGRAFGVLPAPVTPTAPV
jgi:nitroimidazol reductase NimA-like FMN-containing flavoprotein (pyridoxamine 5'-phosphate oxidase superfamily)